jgi:hypothetical protein
MFATAAQLVQVLGQWHVRSQQVSRRNALLACTALAERRQELAEVDAFLASHAARSAAATTLEVGVRPA